MRWIFLPLAGLMIMGCDSNIKDYVQGVERAEPTPTPGPAPLSQAASQVKLSPGHLDSAGTTYSGKMTVSPTKQNMVGSTYSAKLSIQATRK